MLKREIQGTKRIINRGIWLIPESFSERVTEPSKDGFMGISFCLRKGRGSVFPASGRAHVKAVVQ